MTPYKRPFVAIPADTFHYDGYLWHATPEQYLRAVADVAQLTPLIIPSLADGIDTDQVLDVVDGILISGAKSNVQPTLYGEEANKKYGPFDPARDATSFKLIRGALAREIPLLAICRGIQELNVALGGTLAHDIQNLPNRYDHRGPDSASSDERYALRHVVYIEPNSRLSAVVGSREIKVNSVHQQAINRLASDLQIEAKAGDGTIEAVSVKSVKSFALGCQWHPEYWAKTDGPSQKIVSAFGDAVRAHNAGRKN